MPEDDDLGCAILPALLELPQSESESEASVGSTPEPKTHDIRFQVTDQNRISKAYAVPFTRLWRPPLLQGQSDLEKACYIVYLAERWPTVGAIYFFIYAGLQC